MYPICLGPKTFACKLSRRVVSDDVAREKVSSGFRSVKKLLRSTAASGISGMVLEDDSEGRREKRAKFGWANLNALCDLSKTEDTHPDDIFVGAVGAIAYIADGVFWWPIPPATGSQKVR